MAGLHSDVIKEVMRRKLRYQDAKSNKYWHAEVVKTAVRVHYGRQGTTGQTKETAYESGEAATAAAERLVKEKLAKGYVDDECDPSAVETSPTEAPLIRRGDVVVASGQVVRMSNNTTVMGWIELRGELVCDGKLSCLGITIEDGGVLKCSELLANVVEVDNGPLGEPVQVHAANVHARLVSLRQVVHALGICQPFAELVETGGVQADCILHDAGDLNPSWDYSKGQLSIKPGDLRAQICSGLNPFVLTTLLVERELPAPSAAAVRDPLIDELEAWIASHPGPQRTLANDLGSIWLSRLVDSPESVRVAARKLVEREVRSPKLTAIRDAFLAAIDKKM